MGKPKTPQEDPADKAARLRERRMTDVERAKSTEESAAGLSADIRSIYGQKTGNMSSSPYTPQKGDMMGTIMKSFMNQMLKIK
jgi:hypothetical protein